MDPFATLGIPATFALDLAAVEKQHRDLSRALHPDRYVGRPAGERRMALGKAIEVNEAWRLVRDPVRRAEALLRRGGALVGEGDGGGGGGAPPALLLEMMERREALAEARAAADRAGLARLTAEMRQREARLLEALGQAIDAPGGAPSELAGAVSLLGELRFVRRFLEEASAAEDELP
jgi:molecular chaperone HscB